MKYDLAIIGGGPGGYSAALEAVRFGLSTVLFENDLIGGTCLNRGCVPTLYYLHTAELYASMAECSKFGLISSELSVDFEKTLIGKNSVVANLRENLKRQLLSQKINIIPEKAELIGAHTIHAANADHIAENVIIATGSVPDTTFSDCAFTSDQLLEINHVPSSLKIIGGGVIAVEFAEIFNSLGSDVSIYIRGDRILRKWDKEVAVGITQKLKKRGISIHTKCSLDMMRERNANILLSAAGRKPNLCGLNTELFDIGSDGGIVVDEHFQTGTAGIYAVGDVISNSNQLAHIAMNQGKMAVQHIAGNGSNGQAAVVRCIYIQPEIASVGATEAEARSVGINAVSAKQTMNSNARTLISSDKRGFIKLTADKNSGKLIGAQLMCERAGDIASELALAINNNISVDSLAISTRPHPSFCEAISDAAASLLEKIK